MKVPSKEPGHQAYLVTRDVDQKIATFATVGIKTPPHGDPFFDRLHEDLMDGVRAAIGPDVNVQSIRMSDLANDVLGHAFKSRQTEGSLIVSTCREFAEPMKGVTIDINRLVDRDGNSLGIGPRPGAPSLDDQLRIVKLHAADRPVVIVEDGIFSGSTVQFVVEKCRAAGITVNQVVVGFRFGSSQANIDALAEQGVSVDWVEEFGDLIDWVPDHDFLPLVPNCGRIIGVAPFGDPVPYYSSEGVAFSMPYVFPFSPVESWASVPQGAKRELAKVCLSLAQQVYTKLDVLNGRPILMSEVLAAPQPMTLPVKIGSQAAPSFGSQSVCEYLNTLTHSVATEVYSAG